jgi:formylglycine-generating enzyme
LNRGIGLILALVLAACASPKPEGGAATDSAATQTFRDCADCPVMVALDPGRFVMGAPAGPEYEDYERPRHDVRIDYGFALGQAPVTRREFAAFVKETGYRAGGGCDQYDDDTRILPNHSGLNWANPGFVQTDFDPVVCVNAIDAQAYIDWLSKRTGKRYRLPSEAEWEYAARGGNREDRYFPHDPAGFCRYVNGADAAFEARFGPAKTLANNTACNDGHIFTSPVGTFPPNPFGLQDMIGNVMQLIADDWHESYSGAPVDGRAWINDGSTPVLRGGSWYAAPAGLSAIWRTWQNRDWREPFVGFRVARDGDLQP